MMENYPIFYTWEQERRALELVAALQRPTYVLRMASGKIQGPAGNPLTKSARKSYAKAILDIDDIITQLTSPT